jgi:voltage-gated chloride channel
MQSKPSALRDFTVDRRVWLLSVVAIGIGVCATALAVLLLRCIALSTNLFYYHRFSSTPVSPAGSPLGHWMVVVPVVGGLLVGLMARFGSDKIRGHGIPEAIEAILLHRAKVDPKIAVLKPISAAIAIGSGGPFGAEGPIIMTGGAVGSLIAMDARDRRGTDDAARSRSGCGDVGHVCHSRGGDSSGSRTSALRMGTTESGSCSDRQRDCWHPACLLAGRRTAVPDAGYQ